MLVYFAILTPVLLLFCGLVVDVGAIEFKRLQMQSASDAAAMAAEMEIERGTGAWVAAAQGDAGMNGFVNGANSTSVTAVMRPTSGTFAGFRDAVQTTIAQPQYTAFLKVLGKDPTTVNVRSVAVVPPCMYMMGVANLTTYELSTTSATVNAATCPYYIAGQASVDANTTFSAMAENVTGSAGGSSWNGSPSAPPRYGAKTMADPLAAIVEPAAGSCSSVNQGVSLTGSQNGAAGPGTYCGLTSVSCDSTANTLTLYPGLYVIAGTLKVTNCTLTGSGITFFFTQYNGSYGQLVTNGAVMTLSAPASASGGSIPGVLFMTDRAWQTSNAQDFLLTSTNVTGDGIWYLTGAGMKIDSGIVSASNYAGVVADNLVLKNARINSASNFSSVQGGNPFRPGVSLVE